VTDLDDSRARWLAQRDGATGHEYGGLLEQAGRLEEAASVYRELIESDYLVGYFDLAWLEHGRGRSNEADALLVRYLELDDQPDEQTAIVSGVLGHWRWDLGEGADVEALLRAGASAYPSARTDLGHLLQATDRVAEAEALYRDGVEAAEVESFLPLANLLVESGRLEEAEQLYRYGFALGDAHSAFNLHLLLDDSGRPEEAQEWLRLAAEGGDEKAIRMLGDAGPDTGD
jgi:tetratricopeptide (TPR) repeat protein